MKLTPILFLFLAPYSAGVITGSDSSWISQQEQEGLKWYNSSGVETDVLTLLTGYGLTAMRLRVWVNPTDGWCNATDTLNKARRAVAHGMKILIDFHYSDWWADPGKQTVGPGARDPKIQAARKS